MSSHLQTVRKAFELDDATFKSIVLGFRSEYESGLKTASASGLATMIPSYVTTLPTGKETGTYLALDLGGSTLRVCAVELSGSNKVNVTEVRRQIAPNDPMRTTDAITFFDWIADTVTELLQKIGRDNSHNEDTLSLGVCWSFPVE
jgi:hexokinase